MGDLVLQVLQEALDGGIVGGQHHDDQEDGVDQHPVIRVFTECFRQDGQNGGGDDGAEHIALATQDDEDQDEDRGVEVELGRGQLGEAVAEQRSRRARKGGGHQP